MRSQLIPQQCGLPALRHQVHQKHFSNLTFSQIQVLSPSLSSQISCAKYSRPNSNPEPRGKIKIPQAAGSDSSSPHVTAPAFFPLQGLDPVFIKPELCLHAGQKLFSTRLKLPGIFWSHLEKPPFASLPAGLEIPWGNFLPFGLQGTALQGKKGRERWCGELWLCAAWIWESKLWEACSWIFPEVLCILCWAPAPDP